MRIAALAGGVGGARFVRGLVHELREVRGDHESEVVVIGNTGDDITLFGLRICPDLDTILYTLGGGINEAQGWGRDQETHTVQRELAELGAQPQWFGLGDADFATHIARSQWLGQGMSLTEVTARLAGRWGLPGQGVRLLPATDTHSGKGRRNLRGDASGACRVASGTSLVTVNPFRGQHRVSLSVAEAPGHRPTVGARGQRAPSTGNGARMPLLCPPRTSFQGGN